MKLNLTCPTMVTVYLKVLTLNSDTIGLGLVRILVETQLGGSVDVESKNGTEFNIESLIMEKATILIVEDEVIIAMEIKKNSETIA